jgi:hypothetical protein
MRLFVAVTDWNWWSLLASKTGLAEVNFWRPSPTATFQALVAILDQHLTRGRGLVGIATRLKLALDDNHQFIAMAHNPFQHLPSVGELDLTINSLYVRRQGCGEPDCSY